MKCKPKFCSAEEVVKIALKQCACKPQGHYTMDMIREICKKENIDPSYSRLLDELLNSKKI
jgi:hypothetical protein